MSRSSDHFDEFEPHSKYKQLIFKHYFEAWGRKMLLRRGAGNTVLLVDACAGRGMDDVGNHGSPVIAAKAAAMAEGQLRTEFGLDVRVQVVAIEAKPSHYKALAKNLEPFGDRARALPGEFAAHIPAVEKEFNGVPTLWFIDPFGIEPLDSNAVRRALAGDKSEALIMFLDQGALRHFGVAVTQKTETERKMMALDAAPSLFPDMDSADREAREPKLERSRESLRVTKAKSVEIMSAALDRTDWQGILQATPAERRAEKVLEMYEEVLVDCGAKYLTTVPVFSAEGGHVYYLIHAAKNAKARVAMKEAVEYALKHGPLPPEAVSQVRAHLRCNVQRVEGFLRERLAGTRARWSVDKDDRSAVSVRALALEETSIYPSQLDELKERLKDIRAKDAGRTLVYVFPG